MMAPFISMSQSTGAQSRRALFSGYFSSTLNLVTLLTPGSGMVTFATLNTALIALVIPLSSEAVFLDTDWDCPNPDLSSQNPCWPPRISVDPPVVRLLQALLGIIGLVNVIVIGLVQASRCQHLSQDPSSIAGVAELIHHPVLLHDFQAGDPDGPIKRWQRAMPKRRLVLRAYRSREHRWRAGIIPIPADGHEILRTIDHEPLRPRTGSKEPRHTPRVVLGLSNDTLMHISTSMLCLALLAVIVAYYIDVSDSNFNRFFNSNTFGPRFILTSIASILSLGFESLQSGMYCLMIY